MFSCCSVASFRLSDNVSLARCQDEAADVGPKAEAPHRLATEASFYSCASSASDSNQPETEPGGSLAVNSPQDSSGEEADSRLVDQLLHSVEVTSPKAEVVRDAGAGTQVAELEQRAREAKAAEQPTQSGQSVADSEQPEAEGEQTDSAEPESRVARAGSTASATEHFDIGSDIEKESSNASSFLERIGFSRGQQSAGSILTVPEHPVSVEHYLISSDAEHNDGQDGSLSSRSVEKLDLPELPDPEQAAEMHRSTSLAYMASQIARFRLELFVGFPCLLRWLVSLREPQEQRREDHGRALCRRSSC